MTDRIVVTALDRKYFPGLVALWNSIQRNSPDVDFWVFGHGDEGLWNDICRLGIDNIIMNPEMGDVVLPTSQEWPTRIPAMYSRLWVPEIFPTASRSVWLDVDMVVMDSLDPLFDMNMGAHPVASTVSADAQGVPRLVNTQIRGDVGRSGDAKGTAAGLLVFNHYAYKRKRTLEKCTELMIQGAVEFKFVVQSVLNLALRGDFLELDPHWQVYGNRETLTELLPEAKILHYLGMLPWDRVLPAEFHYENVKVWREFYENSHSD